MTSPSCWPQLISRERWSCYLLRCLHAAAFMAATLPSRCKSLSNAGIEGGVGWGGTICGRERGAECLSNPSTSSWRPLTGEITTAAELSADLAFFIRDTCRQNKESFIKGGEGGRVYLCKCVFVCVSTDVTGLYMFNTKWRLTILCQLVIPSSSLKD